jgi:hypothetical protein
MNAQDILTVIELGANDQNLSKMRYELARFTAETFLEVGNELNLLSSTKKDTELSAISLLLRVASQLVSASNDLFADGRYYAASALLRQMVEIEYLAWAFETKDGEGEKWLRSTKEERRSFFTPAKLREAAKGKFRSKDYGYHCELGGHPVPGAETLLSNDRITPELLLADLLGHTGRIWDHLISWASSEDNNHPILKRRNAMLERYINWKRLDPLTTIPPPP